MQLTGRHESRLGRGRRATRAALAATVLLGVGAPAGADETVHATYHSFSDSAKNHVDTWVMEYVQGFADAWSASLRGALDRVHLPPLAGLPGSQENIDAITTASRPVHSAVQSKQDYLKERQELTGSLQWAPRGQSLRASGSYYVSRESDFLGQQASGEVARNWNGGSTALALRGAYGFDALHPDAHLNGNATGQSRSNVDVTLTATQTLSPVTQASFGVELTAIRGFQSNPYRNVYAGGQILPELHPETRLRRAVFAECERYLTSRASASIGLRYYTDDWRVRAGTVDVHFNQYVGDHCIVRYRYRYHTQTAAYFFRDLYTAPGGVDGYRSGDYKLQDVDSNLFGLKVSVPFEGTAPWLDGLVLDLKYERYFDSNSFAANVLEAGFSWPF